MTNNTDPKPEKPTPPPTQTIKEGQDPNIVKPQTTPSPQTTQTSGGDKK